MSIKRSTRRRLPCYGLLVWISCLMALLLPGCGKRTTVPRSAADVPGYLGVPPSLAHIDPSPLRGRRILLDPGHGGSFRGAIGHGGLTEAEINLGVALYLQGMLQWAGAEVHLTRTADVDLLTPADSSLAADLAARVAICDSLAPDVFLSIHHNSTADRDPAVNETQTYYPIGRDGADLDLARAIHRQLVLALAIDPARILPGGFYVLRNVSVPAALGEPAMLSNPVIEGRLGLARSLELEAGAYFLGLHEYFAGGTPRWLTALPDTINLALTPEPLIWVFDAGSPRCPPLDPATISVTIDGLPLPMHLDPAAGTIKILPRAVRSGAHLEISARNLAGRATPIKRHMLDRRSSGPWRTSCIVESVDQDHRRVLFTYLNEGRDLTDGGELRLVTDAPSCSASALGRFAPASLAGTHPLPIFPGRRGWLLLDAASTGQPDRWRVMERQTDGRWLVHGDSAPNVTTLPAGRRWLTLAGDPAIWTDRSVPGDGWRYRMFETGGDSLEPLVSRHIHPRWPVVPHVPGRTLWIEASGARPLILIDGSPPQSEADGDTLVWQPLLPALVGVRVALDPQGGGSEDHGRGPLGTRGSELNLQIARRLAALLKGAGGETFMLRDDDAWLPDQEKVRRAGRFGADFYIAIGRGAPSVRHHPGSRLGRPWAEHCAANLGAILPLPVSAAPSHDYVLRHTACPALVILLEAPAATSIEDRLTTPAWQDAVARSLFKGMAALLQPEAYVLNVGLILDSLDGHVVDTRRHCYALLDGNFQWLPPGRSDHRSLESWKDRDPGLPGLGGHHVLELHCGPQWQLWTLDRCALGYWHGRLRLENR